MAPISYFYNGVQNFFTTANQNKHRLWADVQTWPKGKIVAAFRQVDEQRKLVWGKFHKVKNVLIEDRRDMLNMYYLFTSIEERRKDNLRVNNKFVLNVLEKIGMRAVNEGEYGCIVCKESMDDINLVSLISVCGHCIHTDCLNTTLGEENEVDCPVCKEKYTKHDIYSIEGEQRNKEGGILGKFMNYIGF